MFRIQESTKNTSVSPLLEKDLDLIREQLTEWDRTFGPGVITLWLFDTAFHQVYEANGFEFANNLLTQTRYALKRSEGSESLDWRRRCKQQAKAETQSQTEGPEQPQVEAA